MRGLGKGTKKRKKKKYLDDLVTYQFNFYKFDMMIHNAVGHILSSYQENFAQGHKRTIAEGFEFCGGFVLQDPVNRTVLAATVVEMDHYCEFQNSTYDHHCVIIHSMNCNGCCGETFWNNFAIYNTHQKAF